MSVRPHGLYPILGDRNLSLGELPDAASALAAVGVRVVQLRLKGATDRECFEVQRSVSARLAEWDGLLVVNDRADLAHLLQREARAAGRRHAVGLHLGQTDLPPSIARAIVGPEVVIGCSTHDLAQLARALAEPVDHVAFGPVFPTRTKDDPDPTVGLARLAEAAAIAHARGMPLVAIGGIDAGTAAEVVRAGADAIAVIAALGGLDGLAERASALIAAAGRDHATRSQA